MITINATLVVQIIHFLILLYILNRLMLRPILKLINERTQYVEQSKAEIKEFDLKTEELRQQFILTQNEARKKASNERVQLRNEGAMEAEDFLKDSRREVSSVRSDANRKAEKEVENTRPFLRDQAAALSDDIIERIIGRRIEG
jgi:F0F1-type ATP synthase membrane subunit b/b'